MNLKTNVVSNMTPFMVVDTNQRSAVTYCLHLECLRLLNIAAAGLFKTLPSAYQSILGHVTNNTFFCNNSGTSDIKWNT